MSWFVNRKNVILLLTIISLLVIFPVSANASYLKGPQGPNSALPAATSVGTKVYLPIIFKTTTLPPIFGSETVLAHDPGVADKAKNARLSWVRSGAFSWRNIEPEDTRLTMGYATYNWGVVNEANLNNLAARNLTIIGTIRFTPSWAQKYPPDNYCGPVAEAYFDEFAEFVTALIQRYGSKVKYWEIGNEPDVDPALVPGDWEFGCWGDQTD